jgi:hypothetical protein
MPTLSAGKDMIQMIEVTRHHDNVRMLVNVSQIQCFTESVYGGSNLIWLDDSDLAIKQDFQQLCNIFANNQ